MKSQIMALKEDEIDLDLKDAAAELRAVDRVADEASRLKRDVKQHLEIELGARNIKMAELAIRETRNGMTRKSFHVTERLRNLC